MYFWKEYSLPERIWLLFLMATYLILPAIHIMDWLVALTALVGNVCMALGTKAKIANFYPAILYILMYAFQAHHFNYNTVLYVHLFFHLPLQLVALMVWRRHRITHPTLHEDIKVRQLFPHGWIAVLLGLILITMLFVQLVVTVGEGHAEIDILVFVFGIVGQLLAIGRFTEQWIAWLCLTVFNIGLWTYTSLTVTPVYGIAFMWFTFTINCAYGCYNWQRIYQRQCQQYTQPVYRVKFKHHPHDDE